MLQPIGGELPTQRGAPDVKKTLCKFFLIGTCDKGSQCTWAHGEHELGQPIQVAVGEVSIHQAPAFGGNAFGVFDKQVGFSGPPGPLVQSMGPNAKRTICKFWEQGSCTRGADCTFAHGSADLAEVNGGRVHQESVAAVGTKRTICKFWVEGACTKGAVCSFAHGEEEIGAPLPTPDTMQPMHPMQPMQPLGQGAGPNGVKRTICKFWEQGTCTKGGECTWAHGHEELGAAIPVERAVAVKRNSTVFTTLQPYATAVPVKGGKGMTGKSHGQTSVFQMQGQAPQFEVLQSLSFGVEQPVKKTMCKFWLEGQCTRGASCTWAHGVEDKTVPAHMLGANPTSTPASNQPVVEVRRTLCKFWQQGRCLQAAGSCSWAHGEWEIGTPVGSVGSSNEMRGDEESALKRPRLE